jgi:hypothetical protein
MLGSSIRIPSKPTCTITTREVMVDYYSWNMPIVNAMIIEKKQHNTLGKLNVPKKKPNSYSFSSSCIKITTIF